MSRRYQELDRKAGETAASYDNRINGLQDMLIGYAYFGPNGYNADSSHYGLYIVWNGEINGKLKNPHPEYGYCIDCDIDKAKQFCFGGRGAGVYGKLRSSKGILRIRNMYIYEDSEVYAVSYLGFGVSKPDNVCFFDMHESSHKPTDECSSVNLNETNFGSFNVGSFSLGSFNIGSFNVGSFSLGSFNIGSFNVGSFNVGSFSLGSFNVGSFNVGSFSLGSFDVGSFSLGSFSLGSFNVGSFYTGSYAPGSICVASDSSGATEKAYYITSEGAAIDNLNDFYKDVFGIGYLGYGLNLI